MMNIVNAKTTFTGWGMILAPKKGERAMIGANLAKKMKKSVSAPKGFPTENELFKKSVA